MFVGGRERGVGATSLHCTRSEEAEGLRMKTDRMAGGVRGPGGGMWGEGSLSMQMGE